MRGGGVIHGHHLPPTLQTAEASGTVPRVSLRESVEAFERDLLQDALKSSRGNCARAACQGWAPRSGSSITRFGSIGLMPIASVDRGNGDPLADQDSLRATSGKSSTGVTAA